MEENPINQKIELTSEAEAHSIPNADKENDLETVEEVKSEHVSDILRGLLTHVVAKNPRHAAEIDEDEQLRERELVVVAVEYVLRIANENTWPMARYQDSYYLYTGTHWQKIDNDELKKFLGHAAEKIKIQKFLAKHYQFKESLMKQFYASAYFKPPVSKTAETKINLGNGTYVVSKHGHYLKPFDKDDFMLYKLPFSYDANAECPKFQKYLDRVLPDVGKQQILAEYLGYVFIKNSVLKLEKTVILYGSGSNGKSVFFDVVTNLLGSSNVSNYSLQNLTDDRSYTRSLLSGKLLNYASEISSKMNPTIFKILVSGEPVEARMIYGEPFLLTDYARFMFNTNVLPKDIEHSSGYWRRFLIIHFDQTIGDDEKNPNLANYIIENELPGVFNWILEGLNRLLKQGDFTKCASVDNAVEEFKKDSDSVCLFLEDEGYVPSHDKVVVLKDLYALYKTYCEDSGYIKCSLKAFTKRLQNLGYTKIRRVGGRLFYIEKKINKVSGIIGMRHKEESMSNVGNADKI